MPPMCLTIYAPNTMPTIYLLCCMQISTKGGFTSSYMFTHHTMHSTLINTYLRSHYPYIKEFGKNPNLLDLGLKGIHENLRFHYPY